MTGKSARQISLNDQPAFQDGASDYADSADLERPTGDNRSAEEWARAGLEGAAWLLRAVGAFHRFLAPIVLTLAAAEARSARS